MDNISTILFTTFFSLSLSLGVALPVAAFPKKHSFDHDYNYNYFISSASTRPAKEDVSEADPEQDTEASESVSLEEPDGIHYKIPVDDEISISGQDNKLYELKENNSADETVEVRVENGSSDEAGDPLPDLKEHKSAKVADDTAFDVDETESSDEVSEASSIKEIKSENVVNDDSSQIDEMESAKKVLHNLDKNQRTGEKEGNDAVGDESGAEPDSDEKYVKIFLPVQTTSQDRALALCASINREIENASSTELLTISTEMEQQLIEKFLFEDNAIEDNVWLGLTKEESGFAWKKGMVVKPVTYANWAEQNETDGLDCVQIYSGRVDFGRGQWVKVNCSEENLVVCESLMDDETANDVEEKTRSPITNQDVLQEITKLQKEMDEKFAQMNKEIEELRVEKANDTEKEEASEKEAKEKAEALEKKKEALEEKKEEAKEKEAEEKEIEEANQTTTAKKPWWHFWSKRDITETTEKKEEEEKPWWETW